MNRLYVSVNPYDNGRVCTKKTRKPHPIDRTPTSARTPPIKLYALLGNRAKFEDNANVTKDIEKNRIIEDNCSRLSSLKPTKRAIAVTASPASVSVTLTEWKR